MAVLSLAVAILLVADPWLATSLGFALSASATASLLLFARPLADGLARWLPRALALALAVPLAAQLACGPLLVLITPTVPVYGVLANLLAAPAAPVATLVGLAACLAAPLPVLQDGLAALAWLPASWIAGDGDDRHRDSRATLLPWIEGWPGAVAARRRSGSRSARVIAVATGGRRRTRLLRGAALLVVALTVGRRRRRSPRSGRWPGAGRCPPRGACSRATSGRATPCSLRSAGAVHARRHRARTRAARGVPRPRRASRASTCWCSPTSTSTTSGESPPSSGASARCSTARVHGDGRARPRRAARRRARASSTAHAGHDAARSATHAGACCGRAPTSRAFPSGNDASVVVDVRGGGVPPTLLLGDLSASPQRAIAASGALDPPYAVVKVAHHGSADRTPRSTSGRAARSPWSPSASATTTAIRATRPRDPRRARRARAAHRSATGVVAVSPAADGWELWRERRRRASAAVARLGAWPPSPRRAPAAKTRSAIPQLSWRSPQPAPIVLVSGPEEVCAERAIAGVRDYLRAEDPSLEVSDLRADDYAPGRAPRRHVAVAVRRAAPGARVGRREVLRRVPRRGGVVPRVPAGRRDRHPPPHRRDRARQEAPRRDPRRRRRRRRDRRAPRSSATPTGSTSPRASSRPPKKRIAPTALRALVSAFADDLTELGAACQQLIADVPGRHHRAGRRALLRRPGRDVRVHRRRHRDRRPLRRGAHRPPPRPRVRRRPGAARRRRRVEAAHHGARRRQPRVGAARSPRGSASRTGRSTAPGATSPAGPRRRSGMAIQAAARADAEVKGGSRDSGLRARAPRHGHRDPRAVRLLSRRLRTPCAAGMPTTKARPRRGRAFATLRPSSATVRLRAPRPAWRWPTCGSPPGSRG